MTPDTSFLTLIVKYLNDPVDEANQIAVTTFRSESAENDAYFIEIEKAWRLSEKARLLDHIDQKRSAEKLKQAISNNGGHRATAWAWVRNIAAGLLVAGAGYWLYNKSSETVWLVKATGQNQIDSVKLSDGSLIILAENSELKYPRKFEPSAREVLFPKGQAFFKIAKDAKHPFNVVMDQSNVRVLGTSFNIKLSTLNIDLSVKTGRVMFSPYQGGNTSVLTAGQALIYNINQKQYTTATSQNADAWLTKELVFTDTPLDKVCEQLSAYYQTPIKLQATNKTIKKLNATFKDKTLSEVLEILNETYNIQVQKHPDQIILITH